MPPHFIKLCVPTIPFRNQRIQPRNDAQLFAPPDFVPIPSVFEADVHLIVNVLKIKSAKPMMLPSSAKAIIPAGGIRRWS
jgi:hypothetical protein